MGTTEIIGKKVPLPEYGAIPIATEGSAYNYGTSELAAKRAAAEQAIKKDAAQDNPEAQGETILGQGLGVVGGIIGAYFGGPAGAMVGYKAGSGLGKGVAELATNDPGKALGNLTGGASDLIGLKLKKKVVDPTDDPSKVGDSDASDSPPDDTGGEGLAGDMEAVG